MSTRTDSIREELTAPSRLARTRFNQVVIECDAYVRASFGELLAPARAVPGEDGDAVEYQIGRRLPLEPDDPRVAEFLAELSQRVSEARAAADQLAAAERDNVTKRARFTKDTYNQLAARLLMKPAEKPQVQIKLDDVYLTIDVLRKACETIEPILDATHVVSDGGELRLIGWGVYRADEAVVTPPPPAPVLRHRVEGVGPRASIVLQWQPDPRHADGYRLEQILPGEAAWSPVGEPIAREIGEFRLPFAGQVETGRHIASYRLWAGGPRGHVVSSPLAVDENRPLPTPVLRTPPRPKQSPSIAPPPIVPIQPAGESESMEQQPYVPENTPIEPDESRLNTPLVDSLIDHVGQENPSDEFPAPSVRVYRRPGKGNGQLCVAWSADPSMANVLSEPGWRALVRRRYRDNCAWEYATELPAETKFYEDGVADPRSPVAYEVQLVRGEESTGWGSAEWGGVPRGPRWPWLAAVVALVLGAIGLWFLFQHWPPYVVESPDTAFVFGGESVPEGWGLTDGTPSGGGDGDPSKPKSDGPAGVANGGGGGGIGGGSGGMGGGGGGSNTGGGGSSGGSGGPSGGSAGGTPTPGGAVASAAQPGGGQPGGGSSESSGSPASGGGSGAPSSGGSGNEGSGSPSGSNGGASPDTGGQPSGAVSPGGSGRPGGGGPTAGPGSTSGSEKPNASGAPNATTTPGNGGTPDSGTAPNSGGVPLSGIGRSPSSTGAPANGGAPDSGQGPRGDGSPNGNGASGTGGSAAGSGGTPTPGTSGPQTSGTPSTGGGNPSGVTPSQGANPQASASGNEGSGTGKPTTPGNKPHASSGSPGSPAGTPSASTPSDGSGSPDTAQRPPAGRVTKPPTAVPAGSQDTGMASPGRKWPSPPAGGANGQILPNPNISGIRVKYDPEITSWWTGPLDKDRRFKPPEDLNIQLGVSLYVRPERQQKAADEPIRTSTFLRYGLHPLTTGDQKSQALRTSGGDMWVDLWVEAGKLPEKKSTDPVNLNWAGSENITFRRPTGEGKFEIDLQEALAWVSLTPKSGSALEGKEWWLMPGPEKSPRYEFRFWDHTKPKSDPKLRDWFVAAPDSGSVVGGTNPMLRLVMRAQDDPVTGHVEVFDLSTNQIVGQTTEFTLEALHK